MTATQLPFNLPHKCSFQPYKGSKCGGSSPSVSECHRGSNSRGCGSHMLPNTRAASDLPQTLNSGSHCACLVPNRHILIQSSQPPHEKDTNSIYTSSIRTGFREGRLPAQCRTARKRLQHRVNQSIIPKLLPAPKTLNSSSLLGSAIPKTSPLLRMLLGRHVQPAALQATFGQG